MRPITIIVAVLVATAVAAGDSDNQRLLHRYPREALLNEVVELRPSESYHFNVDAHDDCGGGTVVEASDKALACQFTVASSFELRLHVCDNANTSCAVATAHINVGAPAAGPDGLDPVNRRTRSPNKRIPGFIQNDLATARAQARRERKPILMLFTQLYCPPCNLMKETALSNAELRNAMPDVVLLQIDADIDSPGEIESLKLPGTPTWVLMDDNTREIARTMLAGSVAAVRHWTERELAFRDRPIGPVLEQFESRSDALSDEELGRVVRWETAQNEPAKAIRAAGAMKREDAETVALADRAAAKLAQGRALTRAAAKAVESAAGCEQHWALWKLASEEAAQGTSRDEAAGRGRLVDRALDLATSRSGSGLDFDCRLDRAYLHHIAAEIYARAGMHAEAESAASAAIAEYASFQRFTPSAKGMAPKVLQAGLLSFLRRPQGDTLYHELAGDEPANFTYDFLRADGLADRKDYDRALAAIADAETKATANNWWKVQRLRVQILVDAGRKDDAAHLIRSLLGRVRLPETQPSPQHRFVAFLRVMEDKLQIP